MPDPSGRISHTDDFHRGQTWHRAVRCASTANVTLASAVENGDTIDGVTLVTGDRVLLKNQTAGSENGVYTVNASGAPTRASDMDQDLTFPVPADEFSGAFVYVIAGTANGGKVYRLTNTTAPTVGTTALTFSEFGAGSVTALDDLSDVTITSPVAGDRLRYDGSVWRNDDRFHHNVTAFDGTNWSVLFDGDGNCLYAEG